MELTIFQSLFLGIIQGITEWLPISSSGTMTLVMANFFKITNIELILKSTLLFHLGTFFAVLIYFWKDVCKIVKSPFNPKSINLRDRKIFGFIFISAIITGIIGLIILKLLISSQETLQVTGKTISLAVGLMLFLTGVIQLKTKRKGLKEAKDIKFSDGLVLGITQGLASLPGLSRSGITISTLLLKKFDDTTAFKLSFLMSLPIILIGNIVLNLKDFTFTGNMIWGLLASFIFGILTIYILMKLSRKIKFGWMVLIFALLMIISAII